MIQKVFDYASQYKMLNEGDKVIIGVSGGADSICLLFVLLELRKEILFDLVVVHIEHGLRGEDSLLDARYVEEMCEQNNIVFKKYSYSVKEIAKTEKLSLEEAGRKVRYESFYKACKEYGGNKIAVAHNQNDNAETILLNLFRGTGIKGLSGISPMNGMIIRPLLCISRDEIEKYLSEHTIYYRTDATNFEDDYTRNKIRLHLLPFLKENVNTKAMEHILQAGNYMREAEEFIEKYSKSAATLCVAPKGHGYKIDLARFGDQEKIVQTYIIRDCIEKLAHQLKDITSSHIESLLELTTKEVGKEVHLPYGLIGKMGYSELFLYPKSATGRLEDEGRIIPLEEAIEIKIPGHYYARRYNMELSFRILKSEEGQIIPEKTYTKWFDYDKIKSNLLLRTRKSGDYIQINSQGGNKKLKSYFIDEKIPRKDRDFIPLLADGNHIMWVISHRTSQEYIITKETKNILEVEVKVNGGETYGR